MSQIRHSLDGTIKAQILSREMAHAYLTGITTGPTIYAIRCTLYAVLNMQNKANFQDTQMNVNSYNTTDYENKWQRRVRKNKPNSNPIKPNCLKAKMNVNSILTKDYERNDIFAVYENKPNPNPIQTQTNPIKPCPERSRMGQSRNNSRAASCGIWGFFMSALYLPEPGLLPIV